MHSTTLSLGSGHRAAGVVSDPARPLHASGSPMALGRVPRDAYEARLIRLLVQWLATPLAMLAMRLLDVPHRLFWTLTSALLLWLFWSVLTKTRLECPYCGTSVLARPQQTGSRPGAGIGLPDNCPGCAADLAAPYDPAVPGPRPRAQ